MERDQTQNVARDDDGQEKGKLDTMKVESLDVHANKRSGQRRLDRVRIKSIDAGGAKRREKLRLERAKNNAIDGAERRKKRDRSQRDASGGVNSVHPPHLEKVQVSGGSVVDKGAEVDREIKFDMKKSPPLPPPPLLLTSSTSTSSCSTAREKPQLRGDRSKPGWCLLRLLYLTFFTLYKCIVVY